MSNERETVLESAETISEVLDIRAAHSPQQPFLTYQTKDNLSKTLTTSQFLQKCLRLSYIYGDTIPNVDGNEQVVAILGIPNIDFILAVFALSRLGTSVMMLSSKLNIEAYVHLLRTTNTSYVFVSPAFEPTIEQVRAASPDLSFTVHRLQSPPSHTNVKPTYNSTTAATRMDHPALIAHSSGTTGLPSITRVYHGPLLRSVRATAIGHQGLPVYSPLPFNHTWGSFEVLGALYGGSHITIHNPELPLMAERMMEAIRECKPKIINAVPYVLKMLASRDEGIQALKNCTEVVYGGAALSEPLGDDLVAQGINLIGYYGCTECGFLMNTRRNFAKDRGWNYFQPLPHFLPFAKWSYVSEDTYELHVLPGYPAKNQSNREDGSYATGDLFSKHPNSSRYRYLGRGDDTLVLSNGLNVNPLPLEGALIQSSLVKNAVIVGSGKPYLAVLVIPEKGVEISKEQFLANISGFIDSANKLAPKFAKLQLDAIEVLEPGLEYSVTEKGNAVRRKFIKQFEQRIEDLYAKLERSDPSSESKGTKLSEAELKEYLRVTILDILKIPDITLDQDFFSLGLDSLNATTFWRTITQEIDTGKQVIEQNILFKKPTINKLSSYLLSLQMGHWTLEKSAVEIMQSLLEKYTDFPTFEPRDSGIKVEGKYILLTGASGSLGSHLAAQLATDPEVKNIFCPVRAKTDREAKQRVWKSLRERKVLSGLTKQQLNKLHCFAADLSQKSFGLLGVDFLAIWSKVTSIIDCAWKVNFNMSVESFEDCIAGTHNLVLLALSSPHSVLPTFTFCSSISSTLGSSASRISETLPYPPDLTTALPLGYAQSKLIAEYICASGSQNSSLPTKILRVGQLVGDTTRGIWSTLDAVPLTIQTAETLRALPLVPGDEELSWLPIDIAATTILELSESVTKERIFNVCNPQIIKWNTEFLPALHKAGLDFIEVPQQEWMQRLRDESGGMVKTPAVKLLDYFANKYDRDSSHQQINIKTELACRYSPALREAKKPGDELLGKTLDFWRKEWRGETWALYGLTRVRAQVVTIFSMVRSAVHFTLPSKVTSVFETLRRVLNRG